MAIPVQWDNEEKAIVQCDFQGRWTWDEFFETMAQVTSMMKSVDHRVDAIVNLKPGIMPISGSAMSAGRIVLRKMPANCGVVVVVTNPLVSSILGFFKQIERDLGKMVYGAKSVEEAEEIIRQEREQGSM